MSVILDLNKGNRSLLSDHKKEFLAKLVPLSLTIQEWTIGKAILLNKKTLMGVLPSVILADLIIKSDWYTHPISQEKFNKKDSNNLSLLESTQGKCNTYEGKQYKPYKDWQAFAADYSDLLALNQKYAAVLSAQTQNEQILALSLTNKDPECYNTNMELLIYCYHLGEFDGVNRS